MEEELEQEAEGREHRPYKIMEGDVVTVRRQDVVSRNGQPFTFYSVSLSQNVISKREGETFREYYKKDLYFKNGVDLVDNTKIKIIDMFEKGRPNPRDKYSTIWGIFVKEFEIVEEPNYYQEQDDIETYQTLAGKEESEMKLIDPSW